MSLALVLVVSESRAEQCESCVCFTREVDKDHRACSEKKYWSSGVVTFITVAVTGRGVLWTPTIHHPSSATNHESPTCDWDQADDHWQVPQHGVPPFSNIQVPIGL